MNMLHKKLIRDLKSAKWQFAALTLVLILGVAMFGAMYVGYYNLSGSLDLAYEKLDFADLTVKVTEAPPEVIGKVENLNGVEFAIGRTVGDISLAKPQNDTAFVSGRIVSVPVEHRPEVNDLLIKEGDYFEAGQNSGALVEKDFAEYYGISPGDTVFPIIEGERIPIVVQGVVASPEYIWVAKSRQYLLPPRGSFGVLFLPEPQVRELLGIPTAVNELILRIEEDADIEAITAQVEEIVAPYGVMDLIPREEHPSNATIRLDIDGMKEMAVFVPVLFLLVTAIVMYVLLTRTVHAQRPQIGLMRAEGYSAGQIIRHYLGFSMIVGIVGAALGSLFGHFMSRGLTTIYTDLIGIPYADTTPYLGLIVAGFFIGLAFAALAGILPAWRAGRVRPAEAMRTPPPPIGRIPLIERIFPFLRRLPYLWRMPLRNIFRVPGRTVYTLIGIACAAALVFSAFGMMDSMEDMMSLQFEEVQAYDLKVVYSQPRTEAAIEEMRSWNGVKEVEPLLEIPSRLCYGEEEYTTMLIGLVHGSELYNMIPASNSFSADSEGVLLAKSLSTRLQIDIGDTLQIHTPVGKHEAMVTGFVEQSIGMMAYMSIKGAQGMVAAPGVITGAMVGTEDGAVESVKEKIYALPQVMAIEDPAETQESFSEMMAMAYEFIGVMLLFGAGLGFAIIFNTVTVNVLERSREIATMRTLGVSRRRIAAIITIENVLMGILGIALGIVLGYLIEIEMINMFQADMMTLRIAFTVRSYVITAIGVMLVLVLSQLPSIRYVNNLNLARMTKEQAT